MSAIPFQPFDSSSQVVDKTKSRLPHWSCARATHFVTFRLADSIPAEAMVRWQRKRAEWLLLRGIQVEDVNWFGGLTREDKREYRRLFGASFERLVDEGKGDCYLREKSNSDIVRQCFHHFEGERYLLGDFVIMPNHVHVLLVPLEGFTLSSIVGSWKGFSAREINKKVGRKGTFWQRESFDHVVRNRRQLERLIHYIAENPSKAGLSESDYQHYEGEWE